MHVPKTTRRNLFIGTAVTLASLALSSTAAQADGYPVTFAANSPQIINGDDITYINPYQWVREDERPSSFLPVAIKGSADQLVTAYFTGKVPSWGKTHARALARRNWNSKNYYAAVATFTSDSTAVLAIERVMNGQATTLNTVQINDLGAAGTQLDFELAVRVRSNVVEGALNISGRTLRTVDFEDSQVPMASTPAGTGTGAAGYLETSGGNASLILNKITSENFGEFRGSRTVTGWGDIIFEDDFDDSRYQGWGTVDPSKWNIRDMEWTNYDIGVNRTNNINIANSVLELWTNRIDGGIWKSGMGTRYWGTSYVDSIGKFSATFFRAEIRIRVPNSRPEHKGAWGGFWFRPDDGSLGSEIDVVEHFGYPTGRGKLPNFDQSNIAESTFHYEGHGKNKINQWQPKRGQQTADEFHIWVVERTSQALTFYSDGVVVSSIPNDAKFKAALPNSAPVNIRLNTQAGNKSYWGLPDSDTKNHAIRVDYIRVWKP